MSLPLAGKSSAEYLLISDGRDFPEMESWLPAGHTDLAGLQSAQTLIPCFQEQVTLSKVIEHMCSALFSPKAPSADTLGHGSHREIINLKFLQWEKSLPECVQWNRWKPSTDHLPPSVAALQ